MKEAPVPYQTTVEIQEQPLDDLNNVPEQALEVPIIRFLATFCKGGFDRERKGNTT